MVFQSYALYPHLSVTKYRLSIEGPERKKRTPQGKGRVAASLLSMARSSIGKPRELSAVAARGRSGTPIVRDRPSSSRRASLQPRTPSSAPPAREELDVFIGPRRYHDHLRHHDQGSHGMGAGVRCSTKVLFASSELHGCPIDNPADTFVATFPRVTANEPRRAWGRIVGFRPEHFRPASTVTATAFHSV